MGIAVIICITLLITVVLVCKCVFMCYAAEEQTANDVRFLRYRNEELEKKLKQLEEDKKINSKVKTKSSKN